MKFFYLTFILTLVFCSGAISIEKKPSICFETDVLPIFKKNCAIPQCHDTETKQSGFVLNSHMNIMMKGIHPGKPEKSIIYRVLSEDALKPMPPKPYKSLKKEEIELIQSWILQGAKKEKCL